MRVSIVRRIAELTTNVAVVVAGVCLLLMMAQMVLDVVMKYVFNAPIEGNLEVVSYYYMVAVVFLPLGLVELKQEHISVDMFLTPLPKIGRNIVYALSLSLGVIFVGMLAYQSGVDAIKSTSINEVVMGTVLVPIWQAKWALPIGFATMVLALLANIVDALVNLDSFEPHQESPGFD